MLGLGLVAGVEVLSDICGALSGFIMLVPTYTILTQRRALYTIQKKILEKYSHAMTSIDDDISEDLKQMLTVVDSYDPRDNKLIMGGIGLLIVSFALKIFYHALTKL